MKPVIVAVSRNGCQFESMIHQLKTLDSTLIPSVPGEPALATIGRHMPDLVIVESGTDSDDHVLTSIRRIKGKFPAVPIFLFAEKSSEALAIGALKASVDDYFKYPDEVDDFLKAIDQRIQSRSNISSPGKSKGRSCKNMVGNSQIIEETKDLIERVAIVDSTVLITGETGTGKELAANLIHANSSRATQPLVTVNCAALPENLVESELFGHEKGAFTGAVTAARGRFEQAQHGTLFLDEIGDMTPFAQAKILRVIEDKKISPVGCAKSMPLDFRLIAATNREPETLMEDGSFRDDLFYRLNVVRVHMPSLREHREDIPLLIEHCIEKLNRRFNRNVKGLKKDALELLSRYDWPGNVRELMNVLEGTFVNMPQIKIDYADLPLYFKNKLQESQNLPSDERKRIIDALLETKWNKSTAAKKLNWSRMTLYRKMTRYQIVENREPVR